MGRVVPLPKTPSAYIHMWHAQHPYSTIHACALLGGYCLSRRIKCRENPYYLRYSYDLATCTHTTCKKFVFHPLGLPLFLPIKRSYSAFFDQHANDKIFMFFQEWLVRTSKPIVRVQIWWVHFVSQERGSPMWIIQSSIQSGAEWHSNTHERNY